MIKKENTFKKILIGIFIGVSVAITSQYFNVLPEFGATTKEVEIYSSKIIDIEKQANKIPSICDELDQHRKMIDTGIRQRTEINRKLDDYVKNQENYMKLTDELKSDLKDTRDVALQTKTKVDMIYEILKEK